MGSRTKKLSPEPAPQSEPASTEPAIVVVAGPGETPPPDEKEQEKARKAQEKQEREKEQERALAVRTRVDQTYELVEVHRSQLKKAPYNPRILSDKARVKLRKNLERVGLTHPIVWNKRTGNIVSGHQRLACTDAIERTDNYLIRVAVVDMDEKQEKEQNIFENNEMAQGFFDLDALSKMYAEDKLDFEATGYDVGEVYQLFGDTPLIEQPEQMTALADKMRSIQEDHERIQKQYAERNDRDYFCVVVFKDDADRNAFYDALNLPHSRFMDGKFFQEMIKCKQEGREYGE